MRTPITINWIVKEHISFFNKHGVTEAALRKYHSEYPHKKNIYSDNDFLWGLFQQFVLEIGRQTTNLEDYYTYNIELYKRMRDFLVLIEDKNPNHIVKQINKNELELRKLSSMYLFNLEIVAINCCPECEKLNGKIISLGDAIENQFLPPKKCTNRYGCSCFYCELPIRDLGGNLVKC